MYRLINGLAEEFVFKHNRHRSMLLETVAIVALVLLLLTLYKQIISIIQLLVGKKKTVVVSVLTVSISC